MERDGSTNTSGTKIPQAMTSQKIFLKYRLRFLNLFFVQPSSTSLPPPPSKRKPSPTSHTTHWRCPTNPIQGDVEFLREASKPPVVSSPRLDALVVWCVSLCIFLLTNTNTCKHSSRSLDLKLSYYQASVSRIFNIVFWTFLPPNTCGSNSFKWLHTPTHLIHIYFANTDVCIIHTHSFPRLFILALPQVYQT